jgi:hypothetical protein
MRRQVIPMFLLASVATLVVAMAVQAGPRNFRAHLSGDGENPPVETSATGQATFQLNADGTAMTYRLIVANIEDVRFAHIHRAPAGSNGPVVVTLDGGPTRPGRSQGVLAEGTITAASLQGSLAGMTLADLVALIDAGDAYVNVHTDAHPSGEIRGQVSGR